MSVIEVRLVMVISGLKSHTLSLKLNRNYGNRFNGTYDIFLAKLLVVLPGNRKICSLLEHIPTTVHISELQI